MSSRFWPRTPIGDMPERMTYIRASASDLAAAIERSAGDCRERSLALTHLEEVVMWVNKAIVNGDANML